MYELSEVISNEVFYANDGAELLRVNIKCPYVDSNDVFVSKINAFYDELMGSLKTYTQTQLFQNITQEYENDPQPKKKFKFKKYTFDVSYKIGYRDEYILCVLIKTRRIRSGKDEALNLFPQVWSTKSGMLIPPKYMMSAKCAKLCKNQGAYFVDINNKVYLLDKNMLVDTKEDFVVKNVPVQQNLKEYKKEQKRAKRRAEHLVKSNERKAKRESEIEKRKNEEIIKQTKRNEKREIKEQEKLTKITTKQQSV